MSPPSRDELREKLAITVEATREALTRAAARTRELLESRPGLARTIAVWTIVVLVGLALIGIAVGRNNGSGPERADQRTVPAITSAPRATEREGAPTTSAPPNPGAPPEPGTPPASSTARSESPPAGTPETSASPGGSAQPGAPVSPRDRARLPSGSEGESVRAEHIVVPGETLAKIALRYNVPFEQIAEDSGISDPNRIYVGQRLIITKKPSGVEVIQPGRTLSDYARSSGRGLDELMRLNPQLTNPNHILAGGRLYV